jgi:CspA family cold shock protein
MEQVGIDVSSGEVIPMEINEVKEVEVVGKYTGQCKWFNDKLGYGFVTICDGDEKGKDIFVHHSGIKPLNSNYKTLRKGEYIQFNVVDGINGLQAVDVRGIGGGPLMCDFVSTKKVPQSPPPNYPTSQPPPPQRVNPNQFQHQQQHQQQQPYNGNMKTPGQWQTVSKKAKYAPKNQGGGPVASKRSYRQAMDVV